MDALTAWAHLQAATGEKGPDHKLLMSGNVSEVLSKSGHVRNMAQEMLEASKSAFLKHHLPKFWTNFTTSASQGKIPDAVLNDVLPSALQDLRDLVQSESEMLAESGQHLLRHNGISCARHLGLLSSLGENYRRYVTGLLVANAPFNLCDILEKYFALRLDEFSKGVQLRSGMDLEAQGDRMDCTADDPKSVISVMGRHWATRVLAVANCLRVLNLESISNEAATGAVCHHVHMILSSQTEKSSETGCWAEVLPFALHYVICVPVQFLKLVLPYGNIAQLNQWKARLDCFVFENLAELRIQKLFDMAIDFPSSMPAVNDLRECLEYTTLQQWFVNVFKAEVKQRLLQGGASTTDIIDHFVLVVRMLGRIDPAGVLLNAVAEPYKQYLRGRQDTMKCIVTMLTDSQNEGPSMLEEFSEGGCRDRESDDEGEDDEMALRVARSWTPAPIQAEVSGKGPKNSVSDIISTLVGVYGSNDLFIEEYRKMLGDRLLGKTDYDCDREIRTLELLKLRFGESALHNCEVMLKDMADSKRFQQLIVPEHSGPSRNKRDASPDNISATIISELFWPELPDSNIKVPQPMQSKLDSYAGRYHQVKTPRQLKWKTGLGLVDLDVTVGRTTLSFSVNPVYAVILMLFQNQPRWSVDELAREVGLSQAALRAKALFWVNNGVLMEIRGKNGEACYQRAEDVDKARSGNIAPADLGLEDEGPATMVTGQEDSDYEEMKVFESYTLGFLANFTEGKNLEQIHRHLRTFVIQPKYDKTQDQLANFLARLVDAGKIVHQGGLFKQK